MPIVLHFTPPSTHVKVPTSNRTSAFCAPLEREGNCAFGPVQLTVLDLHDIVEWTSRDRTTSNLSINVCAGAFSAGWPWAGSFSSLSSALHISYNHSYSSYFNS